MFILSDCCLDCDKRYVGCQDVNTCSDFKEYRAWYDKKNANRAKVVALRSYDVDSVVRRAVLRTVHNQNI